MYNNAYFRFSDHRRIQGHHWGKNYYDEYSLFNLKQTGVVPKTSFICASKKLQCAGSYEFRRSNIDYLKHSATISFCFITIA